jgi:hypothetical protein
MTRSLTDTLAVLGNRNHLLGFIKHYEEQIEIRKEITRPLTDAPNYYAWLCVTSEFAYYAVKQLVFLRSKASDSAVFEDGYKKVLDTLWCIPEVTPQTKDDVLLFAKIRHLLVHKGFPNPHDAPTSKTRELTANDRYDAADVWDVCRRVRSPGEFSTLKPAFTRLLRDLAALQGAVELSF